MTDALLCADGPVRAPVDLTLTTEHRRGHGAIYDALNSGSVDVPRLRDVPAGLRQPEAADGRLVLGVDVAFGGIGSGEPWTKLVATGLGTIKDFQPAARLR